MSVHRTVAPPLYGFKLLAQHTSSTECMYGKEMRSAVSKGLPSSNITVFFNRFGSALKNVFPE
jgi:hypothetical protein